MAVTKFVSQPPPRANQHTWAYDQFRRVDLSLSDIIVLLAVLEDTPIEIGPADSAGVGFRALRIPN